MIDEDRRRTRLRRGARGAARAPRRGRSCLRSRSARTAGSSRRAGCAMNASGASTTFLPCAPLVSSSTIVQPCVACQITFGSTSAIAISAPSAVSRVARMRRASVASRPIASATSQNGIESLISSVMPTTAPHHSIALRSSRTMRRAIRYAARVQHSGSNDGRVQRRREAEEHRRERRRRACHDRRAAAAAQQAHERARDEDQRGGGEHGRHAQQPRLVAQAVHRRGEQRNDRRLVDVPERRVAAADDEVQLVAEHVVAVREREVQRERRARRNRARCGAKVRGPGSADTARRVLCRRAVRSSAIARALAAAVPGDGLRKVDHGRARHHQRHAPACHGEPAGDRAAAHDAAVAADQQHQRHRERRRDAAGDPAEEQQLDRRQRRPCRSAPRRACSRTASGRSCARGETSRRGCGASRTSPPRRMRRSPAMTGIAISAEPSRPIANTSDAYLPATGVSACAASCAV